MIYNVTILIRNEKIQHVVNCKSEEEMRERIRRAYKGQAVIYKIELRHQVKTVEQKSGMNV